MKPVHGYSVLVGLAILALTAPAVAGDPGSPSGLGGSWVLNRTESQPPEAGADGPARRTGGRPEGGAAVGRRPGGNLEASGRPGGPRGRLGGAESMEISVDGQTMQLVMGEGRDRVLAVDGQPRKQQRGFMEFTVTAVWREGRVVVTAASPEGPSIKETFSLAGDGSGRLIHTVQMNRPGVESQTRAVWVYDRQ